MIMFNALRRDLKDAYRSLRRRRAFTIAAIFVLGLGIGANTAVFSVVDAVVLRSLPFQKLDRLVWLWHSWTGGDTGVFSIPDVIEYRARNRTFDELAAFHLWGANLAQTGDTERLTGLRAAANFFSVLGVEMLVGRGFVPDDDKASGASVTVLTYDLWQRQFGGDRTILGRTLTLNGEPYVVVGILPPAFVFPLPEAQLAVPLVFETDPYRTVPSANFLRMVGRLKDRVSVSQAAGDLSSVTAQLRELYPNANAGKCGVRVVPVQEQVTGGYRTTMFLLLGAVTLVLLLTSCNIANLLLAHMSTRRKEFAVRAALGGRRSRLMRQVLAENVVLSTLGGAAGVFVARFGISALLILVPSELPRSNQAHVDGRVLAFSALVSILAGFVFGTLPAVRGSSVDPIEGLKAQSRGGTTSSHRFETWLLAGQVALAITLLAGAGLFLRSFLRLVSVEPGFAVDKVLTMRLALPRQHYPDPERLAGFCARLEERLAALPGVKSAAMVSVLPLSGYRSTAEFTVVGRPKPPPREVPSAHYRVVTRAYFRVMQVPFIEGRAFSAFDTATTSRVAIVNHTLARRFWPSGGAVGSSLAIDDGERVTIIGVTADVKHLGLDMPAENDLYVVVDQMRPGAVPFLANNMYWVVRTQTNPLGISTAARQALQSLDRDVAASNIRSMEQIVITAVSPRRFTLLMLMTFATAAFVLAASGVYAVTSQGAAYRTREIGIRIALGATPADVVRLVARNALVPVALGMAVGTGTAITLGYGVQALLFEVGPVDVGTLSLVGLLVTAAAVGASGLPALRAARVAPLVVLSRD